MKKTSEKKSEVRTSEAKEIVFTIAVLIILLTAIALYLNSDFYKDKVLATNISNISIALEEVGYINDGAVRYEESQDKYIIETSAFKKKVSSHKLILCEEISSCLNGSTNFIILSDGIEYYCDYTDTYGLVLYVDGGQIYSEKEQEERESAASSSSGSSSTTQSNSSRVADGYDWVSMTPSQKASLVNRIIKSWESNGFTVSASTEWFVSNINDFYGEATYDFSVAEAASQIGTVGGVLE